MPLFHHNAALSLNFVNELRIFYAKIFEHTKLRLCVQVLIRVNALYTTDCTILSYACASRVLAYMKACLALELNAAVSAHVVLIIPHACCARCWRRDCVRCRRDFVLVTVPL